LQQSVGDKRACKLTVELLALAHDRGWEAELAELIEMRAGCRIWRYGASGSVQARHPYR
jgi:hypothetical protein